MSLTEKGTIMDFLESLTHDYNPSKTGLHYGRLLARSSNDDLRTYVKWHYSKIMAKAIVVLTQMQKIKMEAEAQQNGEILQILNETCKYEYPEP